jgi:hypothetical protein
MSETFYVIHEFAEIVQFMFLAFYTSLSVMARSPEFSWQVPVHFVQIRREARFVARPINLGGIVKSSSQTKVITLYI